MDDLPVLSLEDRLVKVESELTAVLVGIRVLTLMVQVQARSMDGLLSVVEEATASFPLEATAFTTQLQ